MTDWYTILREALGKAGCLTWTTSKGDKVDLRGEPLVAIAKEVARVMEKRDGRKG